MRILLDMQPLPWALSTPSKLPARARQLISTGEVYVSAASIREIGLKAELDTLVAQSRVEPLRLLTNETTRAECGEIAVAVQSCSAC